jgi:hypothetical protein
LQDEYAKLVEGLQEANNAREREDDDVMANPGGSFRSVFARAELITEQYCRMI